MSFSIHKHETIMITRFLTILCRAPRHPMGKAGVAKSVGIIFTCFCRQNEWVSEWVSEFRSWSNSYSMFTVLHILCSGVLEKTIKILKWFQNGTWKNKAFLRKNFHKVWSAHRENLQKNNNLHNAMSSTHCIVQVHMSCDVISWKWHQKMTR